MCHSDLVPVLIMLIHFAPEFHTMPTYAVVPVLALTVIYVLLWVLLRQTQDAKEPPLILHSIPFLGPVFAIISGRHKFFTHAR